MTTKKIFPLLLALIILSANFVRANEITALTGEGEEISVYAIADTATGTVEISGTLPEKKETEFFLLILKNSSASPDSINNANFLENVEFFIQATTDSDGKFAVTCLPMTTWNENEHKVFVAYTRMGERVFSVPSTATENIIITTVKNSSANQIGKLLSGEVLIEGVALNTYLGLDLSIYQTLKNKDSVHSSIAEKTFADIKTISQTLKSAIEKRADEEVSEKAEQEFLEKIKHASEEEIIEIIENNDAKLALDLTGPYGYTYIKAMYDNGEKAPLQSVISDFKLISSFSTANSAFKESVILASVNAADWQTLDDVLKAYETELGLSDLDEAGLSNSEKAELFRELALIDFREISKISSELDALIEKYSHSGGGGIGGSGGGSIGSGGSISLANKMPGIEEKISFDDVDGAHWASVAITHVAGKGILNGYPDGSFKPDKAVSREEFVKILVLSLGLYNKNSKCTFADVNEGSWYYQYVASAFEKGIVNGKGETFGSGENITREEAATMIYRSALIFDKKFGSGMEFADGDSISDYAKEAVSAISGTIINGDENGRFNPSGLTTRAQTAKMIYQLLQMD